MGGAAPGWYDDPERPGRQRYFDGAGWSDDVRAAAEMPPPPPPPSGSDRSRPTPGPPHPPASAWQQHGPMAPPKATPRRGAQMAGWVVAGVLAFALIGTLVGDPPADTEGMAAGSSDAGEQPESEEPDPQPQESDDPEPQPPAEATPDPTQSESQIHETEPNDDEQQAASTPATGNYDRLIVSEDPSADIRGISDVEESLAQQLADAAAAQSWWPLIGEVYVDEDLFISDVRVGVDVLYHDDTTELAQQICEVFVAALPDTDKGLQVLVQPASATGGGTEIDGSDTPWELIYFDTLSRGNNFGDERGCEVDRVRDSIVERTEAYLTDMG